MRDLDTLKHNLIEQDVDLEYFHASNDSKRIRAEVFKVLKAHEDDFRMYYFAVEKSSLKEDADPGQIYCMLFDRLSTVIELGEEFSACDLAVVVTDHLPNEVRKKEYTQRLKALLKSHVNGKFIIRHYRSMSDYGLQVADYFCWMVQRRLEMNDPLSCFEHPNSMRVGAVYGEEDRVSEKTTAATL